MMRALVAEGKSGDRREVRYNSPKNAYRDDTDKAAAMKLIAAIVDERDVDQVMSALTGQHINLTHVSSTGGLISSGDSTLLIGVDEERVPQVMKVIADLASLRQSFMSMTYADHLPHTGIIEVQVGGFQCFVLDVDHFEQV